MCVYSYTNGCIKMLQNFWLKYQKRTETTFTKVDSPSIIQPGDSIYPGVAVLDLSKQMEASLIKGETKVLCNESDLDAKYQSIANEEPLEEQKSKANESKGVLGSLVEKLCNLASKSKNVETITEKPALGFIDDSLVQITPRTKEKKSQTPKGIFPPICNRFQYNESGIPKMQISESSESQFSSEEECLLEKSPGIKLKISEMRLKFQGQEISPKRENPISNFMHRCQEFMSWPKRSPEKAKVPVYLSSEMQTENITDCKGELSVQKVLMNVSTS